MNADRAFDEALVRARLATSIYSYLDSPTKLTRLCVLGHGGIGVMLFKGEPSADDIAMRKDPDTFVRRAIETGGMIRQH